MQADSREALLRRGFVLEYVTLGWNVTGVVNLGPHRDRGPVGGPGRVVGSVLTTGHPDAVHAQQGAVEDDVVLPAGDLDRLRQAGSIATSRSSASRM